MPGHIEATPAGVALGAGVVLVVLVVELLIFSGMAELVEDRVEAGLQTVVESVEAGEGGGGVLGEVLGVDGGCGVAFVI